MYCMIADMILSSAHGLWIYANLEFLQVQLPVPMLTLAKELFPFSWMTWDALILRTGWETVPTLLLTTVSMLKMLESPAQLVITTCTHVDTYATNIGSVLCRFGNNFILLQYCIKYHYSYRIAWFLEWLCIALAMYHNIFSQSSALSLVYRQIISHSVINKKACNNFKMLSGYNDKAQFQPLYSASKT